MAFDLSSYLNQFGGGGGFGNMWGGFPGASGLDLSQLFGQQQGFIGGLGTADTSNMQNIMNMLQGPQGAGMNPFIQQLMGFKPELAGDVRGTMAGIMQDPWGGTARGTLDEVLTTGAPTDVSGIGEAASIRANRALEQAMGAGRERAALSGGLAGSGFQRYGQRVAGDVADMIQQSMLEAGVGAQEAAAGRRMGALGLNLQGQGLAAGTAGQLGGLENQLSGQQLQALLGGGGLAGQQAGLDLQGLMAAGGLAGDIDRLGYGAKQAQAGAGQDFLNMLPGFASSGAFMGGGDMLTPHQLAQYINSVGGAENINIRGNPYFQMMQYMQNPTKAPAPTAPAGGGGGAGTSAKAPEKSWQEKEYASAKSRMLGASDWIDKYGARNTSISGVGGHYAAASGGPGYQTLMEAIEARRQSMEIMDALLGGGGGGAPSSGGGGGGAPPGTGQIPPGKKFGSFTPATFTPPGQPMPQHPAAAAQQSYQDWANLWAQYSQQFVNPASSTAGGYTGA
jgi:hypothetical protein